MWNKFLKNENGFTGLEAAIVLVAFVVVAAVFSYVMLGAGFYTTQKSQEVVHTGVQQASSSVELSGDVVAHGDDAATPTEIETVELCLQLTSGGSPVDMDKTLITFSAPDVTPTDLVVGDTSTATTFAITDRFNGGGATGDNILDRFEKFQLEINVALVAAASDGAAIEANDGFQIEIKPPQGATYTLHRTAPPSISAVMSLY